MTGKTRGKSRVVKAAVAVFLALLAVSGCATTIKTNVLMPGRVSQAAQFKSDERSEESADIFAAGTKYLVARMRLREHIPDNELDVFEVTRWNRVAVSGFTRRNV